MSRKDNRTGRFPLKAGEPRQPIVFEFAKPSQVIPYRGGIRYRAEQHRLTVQPGQCALANHIWERYVKEGRAWLEGSRPETCELEQDPFDPHRTEERGLLLEYITTLRPDFPLDASLPVLQDEARRLMDS